MKNALKLLVGTLCLSGSSVAMADLPANLLDLPTYITIRYTFATATVQPGEEFTFGPACHKGEVVLNGFTGNVPPGFAVTRSGLTSGGPPNNISGWAMGFTNDNATARRVTFEIQALCTRGSVKWSTPEILVFPE